MGLFSSSKKAEREALAQEWEKHAAKADKQAREARQRLAKHRKRLASGSDDPAADRYMIRDAESDLRIAEANARDFRKNAEGTRKWG